MIEVSNMIYKVYERYKKAYYESQEEFHNVLNKKEELFQKTQPQSTDYNKDKSSGGKPSNSFDNYLISLQEKDIDNKLNRCRKIMKDRKLLLELKEEELRKSKNKYDVAYVCRYLDNMSVKQIERKMAYCKTQVYGILKDIERNVKTEKNGKKLCYNSIMR
jgi:hypothetical protein